MGRKVKLYQIIRKGSQLFLTQTELIKFFSEEMNDSERLEVIKLRQ